MNSPESSKLRRLIGSPLGTLSQRVTRALGFGQLDVAIQNHSDASREHVRPRLERILGHPLPKRRNLRLYRNLGIEQLEVRLLLTTFYLNGDSVPTASLKTTAPTDTSLNNFDPGRDSFAGLLISKGGSGANETDATKHQAWVVGAGSSGLTLDGTATLTLYTAMKDFDTSKGGSVTAYLVDCDASANNATAIATATVTRSDWDTANSGTWIETTFNFGYIDHTVASNRSLGVIIVVGNGSGDDMWFAYDATQTPSALHITEPPANVAPTTVADSYVVNEDTTLNVTAATGLLANDTDSNGNPLAAQLVSGPAHGSLTFNSDGSFSYTPDANYHGADSFTYRSHDGTTSGNTATVSITVNSVNDAPVANDENYAVDENGTLHVPAATGLLANDADAEGSTLTAQIVNGPSHGSLTLNGDGSFSYTPDANYHGTDSFTYTAYDGDTSSVAATVSITINAIDDVIDPEVVDETEIEEVDEFSAPEPDLIAESNPAVDDGSTEGGDTNPAMDDESTPAVSPQTGQTQDVDPAQDFVSPGTPFMVEAAPVLLDALESGMSSSASASPIARAFNAGDQSGRWLGSAHIERGRATATRIPAEDATDPATQDESAGGGANSREREQFDEFALASVQSAPATGPESVEESLDLIFAKVDALLFMDDAREPVEQSIEAAPEQIPLTTTIFVAAGMMSIVTRKLGARPRIRPIAIRRRGDRRTLDNSYKDSHPAGADAMASTDRSDGVLNALQTAGSPILAPPRGTDLPRAHLFA